MNKLILLSLAAFVACTVAKPVAYEDDQISELALFEDDDVEVAGVKQEEFKDYCVRSRDNTKVFLEASLNSAALRVFNTLFNSIDQIAAEASAIKDKEVEFGKQLILDVESKEQVDGQVQSIREEEVDGEPENVSAFKRFVQAGCNVARSFVETLASEAMKRLVIFKGEMTMANFKIELESACDVLTDQVKVKLAEDFGETKSQLIEATTDEQRKIELNMVRFENVGCVTTKRIVSASRVCYMFKSLGPILYPLLEGLASKQ